MQKPRKKKAASLKVACWNIRTMHDSEDRPQRRSALVAREQARLDIDIAALCEVRFAEQGSLTQDGGYSLFWSRKNNNERRFSGKFHAQKFHYQKTAELASW